MSEATVFANGLSIASKSVDGKSLVAFPDPCWSPPPPTTGPIVLPYANTAYARDTANGSKSVLIGGKPIMQRDKSYFSTSTGNEAATRNFAMGVSTHTIKGKAYFRGWSPNVTVEGYNVCRHTDPLTHNHGSFPGNTPEWRYLESKSGTDDDCKHERQRINNACGEECKQKNCTSTNQHKWKENHCEGLQVKPYDLKNKFGSLDELKQKLSEQANLATQAGAVLDQAQAILVSAIEDAMAKIAAKAVLKKIIAVGGPVGWIITGIDTALDGMETADLMGKLSRINDEVMRIKNDITGLQDRVKNIDSFDEATALMADIQRDIAVIEPCLRARKCMLVSYDDSQKNLKGPGNIAKGCCPGQTGHHLIPDSYMFRERSCSNGSETDVASKKSKPAKEKVCQDYDGDKAPTICVEGTSWHKGSHKAIHQNFEKNLHDSYKVAGAEVPMDDAREAALDGMEQTFPLSMCSKKCMETQLKNYYNQACESSKSLSDFGEPDPDLAFHRICPVSTTESTDR